jgi:hypothetical protein
VPRKSSITITITITRQCKQCCRWFCTQIGRRITFFFVFHFPRTGVITRSILYMGAGVQVAERQLDNY